MSKLIYFHIEKKENGELNLISNAYKDGGLQLKTGESLKESDYKTFNGEDNVGEELLKMIYRNVYGSPMGCRSRCTLQEIASTDNSEFGKVDMSKFREAKGSGVREVLKRIKRVLLEESISMSDTNSYRVIVEIKN